MFDVHNVLDDRWNQLIVGYFGKAYPLELVQRWEEMSSILSTCSYAKIIDRGIIDLLRELGQAILILTWYLFPPDQFGLEFPFEVWDPGRHLQLLVNSYISKIIKNKIHGVDISDILLQTDKSDTNDSPDEGSDSFWFCLQPTTHDLALVPLEPLSSYFTITGGQTLFIESSVGYSCNASKGLYIAGEVHLLVLYANFDAKHEGIVQEPPSLNDDQQSSHKSLFPRHIGYVHFYYVVESAKRTDSAFFLLASIELVFMKRFLIEKDFHVLPVKRRESYNADGLLVSVPSADVHEDAKHDLENDSKLPWTYHTLCHVYQCEICYKEAILSEANCSTPWSPLSFFNCTHNEERIALCYTKKTRMKLTCSLTDVFLPSYLVEQMVVPWIGFRNATSFSLSVRFNKDPIRVNVEMLAIPSSSTLLGICYMPPEVGVQNLQLPLPSVLNHMARNLHKTNIFVLNFFEKFSYESVTFPSSIWFYLNLEDKVLISGGHIVVNTAGQVVGLEAKPQRGPRIRQTQYLFCLISMLSRL